MVVLEINLSYIISIFNTSKTSANVALHFFISSYLYVQLDAVRNSSTLCKKAEHEKLIITDNIERDLFKIERGEVKVLHQI